MLELTEMEEVVSVWPSHPRKYTMHTTRSWEFVGLDEGRRHPNHYKIGGDLLSRARYGQQVIVGVLDSGNVFIYNMYIYKQFHILVFRLFVDVYEL